MLLILKLKMMIICRECNIEIDTSSGYPEHELRNHYNNLHNNLIARCMKCMHENIVVITFWIKVKLIVQVL